MTLFCITAAAFVITVLTMLLRQEILARRADHAKCIAHIASVTSNRFLAERVRGLADQYGEIEAMTELTRIRNTRYAPGGPEVPAIWLRDQADRIEAGQ